MKKILFACISMVCIVGVCAESMKAEFTAEAIPLKKVTLYSSGVAHYEHKGAVSGSGNVELLFSPAQMNDVLKSLVVTDPAAKNVAVDYQAEDTLRKSLESLKVDLSATASLYDMLKAQKGAEVELFTPHQITGKILSVDKNRAQNADETFFISLAAPDGIHIISFSDIQFFKFTDESRNADLHAALALILDDSAKSRKKLGVKIDAQGDREVGLSYVMEAPVWKASYRIDMGAEKAAFQAWAIIDNSTDLDWNDITLTLTTGRPVGFTQNLYAPYYTYRPELPLAIAQAAEAETFASDDAVAQHEVAGAPAPLASRAMMMKKESAYTGGNTADRAADEDTASGYFDNQAASVSAGELFAFTPSKPITLERQHSTMIPLAFAALSAEKCSVFSSIPYKQRVSPKFCLKIENTSGLKLPAGPITVFDGGEYAGDALLEFLPEHEKRLIAYGDDLEVSSSKQNSSAQNIETVAMADGIVTIAYRHIQRTEYALKNAGTKARTIIVEHQKTPGFELTSKEFLEETAANKYRFKLTMPERSASLLAVEEARTYRSTQKVFDMNTAAYLSYTTNAAMPEAVRKTFAAIIAEKEKVTAAEKVLKDVQKRQTDTAQEQDRVRKNLEAVGAESQQGRAFLTKLLKLESDLDTLKADIVSASEQVSRAQAAFTAFVKGITLAESANTAPER